MARRKIEQLKDAAIAAGRILVNAWQDPSVPLFGQSQQFETAMKALDAYCIGIPDSPGSFNRNSPETAKIASQLSGLIQGSTRRRIVDECISCYGCPALGLTDRELETRLRGKHQTVSSARNWLVNAGWLVDSGKRRKTDSGRPAVVWQITPAGHARYYNKQGEQ